MEAASGVGAISRHWKLILVFLWIGAVAALGVSALLPKQYTADSDIYISPIGRMSPSDISQGAEYISGQMTAYQYIATTPAVLEKVNSQLGLRESITDLQKNVTVEIDGNVLKVSAEDTNPGVAASMADTVAASTVSTIELLSPKQKNGDRLVQGQVITRAAVPNKASSPRLLFNTALGGVLGAFIGAGVAFWLEGSNRLILRRYEIESEQE